MTRYSRTSRLAAAFVFAALPAQLRASPRDEALRVAPPDAALVLVVQGAREHAAAVAKSPFAEWFPTSALGKQLSLAAHVRQFREASGPLFDALGVTPDDLVNDVFGEAVVFAYTPAPAGDPKGERAVVLVRPRKRETLAKLVARLNELQTGNDVKAVARREYGGGAYYERRKTDGGAEFYCFCGPVFAFSVVEADVKAVIDRDRDAARDAPPAHAARLSKLGVTDAAAVLLVNPRPLDAEVRAKVAAAKPDEKPFLDRFGEAWSALDAAAVYVAVGAGLEAGVALDFRPADLSPTARAWLTGARSPPALAAEIPDDALFTIAARFHAGETVAAVRSLLPEKGRKSLDAALDDTLGAVVGRGRLPLVLDALGPDWAAWAEPPAGAGFLPVVVGAVRVKAVGPRGKEAARAIERAVSFGFQAAQVAYNATHADQIETAETPDGDAVVTSLVNDAAFPPGVRPSFAFKGGYLVASSSPDGVQRFRPPTADAVRPGEVVTARFSAAATRTYLLKHRAALATFAANAGGTDKAELLAQLDQVVAALEAVEKVELVTRGSETGVRFAVRVKLTKPLK